MRQAAIIGIDLAKKVFQLHGADAKGSVIFCKKLSRARLLPFLASQPPCVAAMEARAAAHDWGRHFSAWLGLVLKQHTTGGKPRLGKISKMGQRDIRKLLVIGAMANVAGAVRYGTKSGPWLARMLDRKPRMVVAVALANKMARAVWAMLTKGEPYRDPAIAAT